jgi:hypothetical protein
MPLVRHVAVENREGKRIGTYPIERIEDAVAQVDEMALQEGQTGYRVYRS